MDDPSAPKMPWRSVRGLPDPEFAVHRKLDRICTNRLRKVIRLANREASRLGREYIGTEHLLIGLLKEGVGIAVKTLKKHLKEQGVSIHEVRKQIERLVGLGPEPPWDPQYRHVRTAITRHFDNKGGRTERIRLHPVVIQHLQRIPSFAEQVFPWPHDRKALDNEFHRLQQSAGIHLPCHEDREHTPACHLYGFHDLRRGFATMNAGTLSADALQALMRHKSYQTTQRYINIAPQVEKAVESLHVPEVLRSRPGGR